jgi:hypothetical protein
MLGCRGKVFALLPTGDNRPEVVFFAFWNAAIEASRLYIGEGRKDFLPVEPQNSLSFLILLSEPSSFNSYIMLHDA